MKGCINKFNNTERGFGRPFDRFFHMQQISLKIPLIRENSATRVN